jgi:hypothetical protein
LFGYPASGDTFSSTAIEIIKLVANLQISKVIPHLEAWVPVGGGIPHVKDHNGVLRLSYSKEYKS